MDVEAVDRERLARDLKAELAHPVKVDEQRQEDLVGRRAVLEDPLQIDLDVDAGDVSGVEAER